MSAIVATTLALGGLTAGVAAQTATAPPAAAQAVGDVNPFSSTGGFTVYARQNATLGNDELEGSLAVGDTLTVTDYPTYAFRHVSAGTGDYTLPTVDGDPTRLLTGRYSAAAANVGSIEITNAGAEVGTAESRGTLKMVERDISPFETSARGANWVRVSLAGSAPLIDATAQTYPADASPPNGTNTSIFTAQTGANTASVVEDYVRANEDATLEDIAECLAAVTDPSGQDAWHVGVAEDVGDRKVLGPLAADRANVVAYEDIAGARLLQFSTEVRPGASNPLIIKVPEGTTAVQGLRIDPAGEYASYTMWDLSEVTGAVTVANPNERIDGSIYAPFADVSVNAAPLEGHVFGNNVHLLGGELHSYLFAADITCGEPRGTFQVSKQLEGITADDLPEGITFALDWTATLPDGTTQTGTIQVPADGTPQRPVSLDRTGTTFPVGTVVEFAEPEPGSVPGWDWTGSTVVPNPVTITADGDAVVNVTLTNTAERQTGTFEVTKSVTDGAGDSPALPEGTAITVAWTADRPDGGSPSSGTLELVAGADGSFTTVGPVDDAGDPVQFPVGTQLTLEEPSLPDPPAGFTWGEASWSPGSTFTIERADEQVSVELTNLLVPTAAETAFTALKVLDAAGEDIPTFSIEYTFDPPDTADREIGQAEIAVGEPVRITTTPGGDPIPAGSTVWVREAAIDEEGWDDPVLSVDGEPLTDPDADGYFALPLADGATVALEVTNRRATGSFTLAKVIDGVDEAGMPEGLEFTVGWTATYPDGSVESGSAQLVAGADPVPPVGADGEPLTFPHGTTVTFAEAELPVIPGWTWGATTIEPETLTVTGNETAAVTVTNSAVVQEGTFEISKAVSGIDAGDLLADAFAVGWTATLPDGSDAGGTIQVPADGTAAGPGRQFPVGTLISVTEQGLPADALPPLYEWGTVDWAPGTSLVIEPDGDEDPLTAELTMTNTAVPGTSLTVEKAIEDGTDGALPADVVFPVEYTVLDVVPVTEAEIAPGEPLVIDRVEVGSLIQLRELDPPDVPGVAWGDPVWTLGGEVLEPDADGWVVVQAESTEPLELTLTNAASQVPEASFTVAKSFDGIAADDLPDGTTFPVDWTAALPDGTSRTGTLDVAASGEPVGPTDDEGAVTFPAGTRVTYAESAPEVDGIVWDSATFAPESVVIGDDGEGVAVSLTNAGHLTTPVTPGTPETPGGPGTAATPQGPQLPVTGFGGVGLLLAAAGLVLLGVMMRRLSRGVAG